MNATIRGLSSRSKIFLGVLAAVLATVVAFSVGVAVGRPDYPGEGSADVGFARDMSAHHAQAVDLGMIAFQNATLGEVRAMGGDIATTQKGQIGLMQGWLATWGVSVNTASPMAWVPDGASMMRGNLMPGMATREEIEQLQDATGEQVDILFLQYMLRHHLGGIHMVDAVLGMNPSEPVRALAQSMKSGQQREIDAMYELLSRLGASPLPD